jgi:hypothetical protein
VRVESSGQKTSGSQVEEQYASPSGVPLSQSSPASIIPLPHIGVRQLFTQFQLFSLPLPHPLQSL